MPELQIIDLSSNNAQPWDFAAVKASGVTGVIIKATEGVGYVDPFLADAWKAAKAAGLWVGGYHFAHPGTNSAEAEAAHFVATIGPLLEPGDGAALDIEVEGSAPTNAFSLALAAAVAKALGFPPMVYSYPDFIQHWLTDKGLGAYPLWLASLTNICPPSMGPWPYVTLWQNTWTANVPGIPGQVDRSVIARDLAGLKALGKPAPKPAVTRVMVPKADLKPTPDHVYHSIGTVHQGDTLTFTGQTTPHWAQVKMLIGMCKDKTGWLLRADLQTV